MISSRPGPRLVASRPDPAPTGQIVYLPPYTGGRIRTVGENIARIGTGLGGGQTTTRAITAARANLQRYIAEAQELLGFLQ